MDEEDEQNSRGAYDNMDGPNIRPDFVAASLNNARDKVAKNLFQKSEDSASKTGSTADKNVSEKVADGAKAKTAEKTLDAATGGFGGKLYSGAKKAGLIDNHSSQAPNKLADPNKLTSKAKLKKALPVVAIVALVGGILAFSAFAPSFLTLFGKWYSARMKEDNGTGTNRTITDFQINNCQLGGTSGSSEYGETVFDEMCHFSDYQIQSFKQAGLDVVEMDDGQSALAHTNYDGSRTYYVADSAITGYIYVDEDIGDAGLLVTDSGAEGKTREERITELATLLGAKEEDKVEPFSNITKNFAARNEYIAATESYRGEEGIWMSDTASSTQDLLGVNLNTFKNHQQQNNSEANKEAAIQDIARQTARNQGAGEEKSVSYEDLSKEFISKSKTEGCGYDAAAVAAGSIANALETVKQTTAGAALMEAIDKTIAGFGNAAPMNELLNMLFESGGTDTESLHYLSSGNTKINQTNETVLSTIAQANLGKTGNPNYTTIEDASNEVTTCVYVNNVNSHNTEGIVAKISGMFTKVTTWIKSKLSNIASFIIGSLKGVTEEISGAAVSAIEPAVARFNQMLKTDGYFTGKDDKRLGEAVFTATKRISHKMTNTVTGATAGNAGAVKAAYRMQQEAVAEKAEYDRTTKSPFDTSSRYTFLGNIAYSLIPFALSNTATSLSSIVSNFGSILKNAASNILPTSNAISETNSLSLNSGDCIFGNSVGAFDEASCLETPAPDKASKTRISTNIFNDVANLRKDEGGYVYGINANEVAPGETTNGDYSDFYIDFDREEGHITNETEYKNGTGRAYSDVDYGNAPLNDAENSTPSYWGTGGREGQGEAHGCESDWQYQILPKKDENGNYVYDIDENGIRHQVYYRYYDFSKPSEWKYSRLTNFEYKGYKTGYPNLINKKDTGKEGAKNDVDPGTCMLDLKTDSEKQPVINLNGALYMLIQMSGQRTSELGVSDQKNIELLSKTDFIHGRLHPCSISNAERICREFRENENGWSSDEQDIAEDEKMSRWISGSAYVLRIGEDDESLVKKGYETEEIFTDPTRGGAPFSEEITKYSAYIALTEWMSASDLISRSSNSLAIARYYKNNPLDNSYEGIIARYSGQKKETVIAFLDLLNYADFLANYDPTDLYPLTPESETVITYDNPEIIATTEPAINNQEIIFDELRNRTVTV